jgi:hypothetical protein
MSPRVSPCRLVLGYFPNIPDAAEASERLEGLTLDKLHVMIKDQSASH